MYYKGVYHFFYQHNPYGPLWGNMSWAHAISHDLINWVHLDIALVPNEPYDINGCFSGSTTILPSGEPAILYTGVDANLHQVQNLAFPKNMSDPLLNEWVKWPLNPILSPPDEIDPSFYRDPSTGWMGADGEWRVVIGTQIDHQGAAILYKSKDFRSWNRSLSPLHLSNITTFWECPDFYPVIFNGKSGLDTSVTSVQRKDIRHVLKASFNYQDYYILGKYDPLSDRYDVDADFMKSKGWLRYDYGRFYASKSFYDGDKKRRILWSWVCEGDTAPDAIVKGWSGLQTIPRSIWLSKNEDQLVQWPVKELEKLRTRKVHFENKKLKGGSMIEISGITASQVTKSNLVLIQLFYFKGQTTLHIQNNTADVEITFSFSNLKHAEVLSAEVVDPQILCTQKNATTYGKFGPFGLLVLASKDLTEHTAVFFRVFRIANSFRVLMCADSSRSSLKPFIDKPIYGAFLALDPRYAKISLRTLIDHSIVESFGGEGLACITSRVYPVMAVGEQAHLYAFNNGTQSLSISSLSAWSMKKAQIV
ncbi:putative fructan beta-(2,1)-fructosidase [Helianthus anomalus]